MRANLLLGLTLVVYLLTGHAPGPRELRNPDAEKGAARAGIVLKRSPA